MLVVLDTTVLIDCLRGRPAVERVRGLWQRGDIPATTAVNVEELVRGMRPAERGATQTLLDGVVQIPVDAVAAWRSGQWRREWADRGTTLAQADCLIAAVAHRHAARLATGNPRDFPMPELEVEHWPVGT